MSGSEQMARTGALFVVSAPSGAGKTSLVKAALEADTGICLSVSHTTRAPRPGEVDGGDYHFVDTERFRAMQAAGEFLESAQVFDNFYGTALASVTRELERGKDVILEIDWQGARQVRTQFPDARTVFVLPPSREALRQRLQGRGQDSEAVIARRMRDAVSEITHYDEFDFVVINDDFDEALAQLLSIFQARRLERSVVVERNAGLIADLLA